MSARQTNRHRYALPALLAGLLSWTVAAADEPIQFDIPAQPAAKGLNLYAEQAGLQIMFPYASVKDIETNEVIGEYDKGIALETLLANTGLEAVRGAKDTATIRPIDSSTADQGEVTSDSKNAALLLTAQNQTPTNRSQNPPDSTRVDTAADNGHDDTPLEEIIVTGTNIRGVSPVGSQLITLDRADIDRTGLSSVQDVLATLPQMSGAGPNADTSSVDGVLNNFGFGSSINLRGLGSDKTLTLVNGRRVAPGGTDGGFVDVSLIPVTAVERIEILADGASALYGSDAIGGVVNIILKEQFDGAETSIRYGSVTDGELDEVQFGQVFGGNWRDGNALFVYEFSDQEWLLARDRDFAASSDLTPFGGDNFNDQFGNPGTIVAAGQTFAIPSGQDGTSLLPSQLVPGTSNDGNRKEGTTIFPSQRHHSIFGLVSHDISPTVSVFADGRFTKREFETLFRNESDTLTIPDSNPFFVDPVGGLTEVDVRYNFIHDLGPQTVEGDVTHYGGSLGSYIDLRRNWQLEISGSISIGETSSFNDNRVNSPALDTAILDTDPATAFNPFGDGSNTSPSTIDSFRGFVNTNIESETWSLRAKADGTLATLPSGEIKAAIGVEYFEDTLSTRATRFTSTPEPIADTPSDLGRDVGAIFAEFLVPIVAPGSEKNGVHRLEFSAAGRLTDYSDFGDTVDPKFGVLWSPFEGFDVRATYGTSFRAPLLPELDDSDFIGFALPLADPASPTGFSTSILLFGGNADLKPEEATTFTAGLDFRPSLIEGLQLSMTFFDIELENRILQINNPFSVLPRESEFQSIVTRNPDPAVAQAFLDIDNFFDFLGGVTGADIEVIIDARLNNIAVTKMSGLDLGFGYDFAEGNSGHFRVQLDGSWLFEFDEAISATSPLVDVLNTVGRPTDLKARGSLSWQGTKGTSATVFVNYVDGYHDDVSDPERSIGSWTTVDLNVTQEFQNLGDLKLAVQAQNVFDSDPPFVNNGLGIGYDPANADPRGRFIAVQLVKRW